MTTPSPERAREPGALIGLIALVVGLLWIAGGLAAAIVIVGPDRLLAMTALEIGALAGALLLPALMAWFSGLAARDSARARHEARRLADAADRLMNPERSAEDAARQLAESVRGEINTLDRALETTLARLKDVEGQIARQAQAVDAMSEQAKSGANQMITGMEREREELMRISRDLTSQAQTIGASISKHTQSIAEAAQIAEAEVRAADQALDHRLTSFGAAAALITDRTQSLTHAAQSSADSALRLETALSNALDILAKATSLTDAARQSADAASLAANSTAGAVRDTTVRAVEDAKRAADLIRSEAAGVEREAALALERLREAAEAARTAAVGARHAIEDDVPPAVRVRQRAPAREEPTPSYDTSWRDEPDPLEAAPPPSRQRREVPRDDRYARDERMFGEREATPAQQQNDWTWRQLLSNVDNEQPARSASRGREREPAEDPVAHLRRPAAQPRPQAAPSLPIVTVIEDAGLSIDQAFSPSGLERIAQRARSGTQARRRAVYDAAPDATRRLADYLARNQLANKEAMQFLGNEGGRIAELIGRGRASMNAEATRAFLLIDAAAG
jgi:archaellum component FlaC